MTAPPGQPVEIASGIHQLVLPMPTRLGGVNVWILRDSAGPVIVDAGLHPHAERIASAVRELYGQGPARVVLTHFHPDHVGGTGALQQLTGCSVWGTARTIQHATTVWGSGSWRATSESLLASLLEHGMPPDREQELREQHELAAQQYICLPEEGFEVLDTGGVLRIGDIEWRIVPTSGHADGHICLHAQREGYFLSGDHVLERITPAVGLHPGGGGEDPLGEYLRSLEAVSSLPVTLVLPGHGEPFSGLGERCRHLRQHHDVRLHACHRALGREGATAWHASSLVFGEQPDVANERFALTETLAHLEYLVWRGYVERDDDGYPVVYRPRMPFAGVDSLV